MRRHHHLATRRYTAAPRRRLGTPAAALTLTLIAAWGALQAVPVAAETATATPIHHLVVIFQENVSFDHYFGTYPNAANIDGQPFIAQPGTPAVNGLSPELLLRNPNSMLIRANRLAQAGSTFTQLRRGPWNERLFGKCHGCPIEPDSTAM